MEDREGVGRVVRGRDQPPAVAGFQDGRVAVADQDLRVDVLGQQRPPVDRRLGIFGALTENMRQARAEVARQRGEEVCILLLLIARQGVGPRFRRGYADDPPLAVFAASTSNLSIGRGG